MVDKIDNSPVEGGPPENSGAAEQAAKPNDKGAGKKRSRGRPRNNVHARSPKSRKPHAEHGQASSDKLNGAALPKSLSRQAGRPIERIRDLNRMYGSPEGYNEKAARRRAYAAIDLGTNNCRLLIARPSFDGFIVIDAFSRVVRLGEGLAKNGRISDQAMDRAVAALSICADKLRRRNVSLARSVATEACRRASNGDHFIERVRKETGIALNVITAEEEARLAVLGCHVLLEPGNGPALIFDIGGGSTELVLVSTDKAVPEVVDWESAPWGVVSLTESVQVQGDSVEHRMAAYQQMRDRAAAAFAEFAKRLPSLQTFEPRLLGTSGTVTTLASLHLELPAYDRNKIDGLIVPSASMRQISHELAALSPAERQSLPCIGKERADLVVAGCAILDVILDLWPAAQIGVADRGIREGILRTLIESDQPKIRKR